MAGSFRGIRCWIATIKIYPDQCMGMDSLVFQFPFIDPNLVEGGVLQFHLVLEIS